jgi:hypothetical protein
VVYDPVTGQYIMQSTRRARMASTTARPMSMSPGGVPELRHGEVACRPTGWTR